MRNGQWTYVLLDIVGVGSYGSVYKAQRTLNTDSKKEEIVAIKKVKKDFFADQEIKINTLLSDCPYICKLLDSFKRSESNEEFVFLVFEFSIIGDYITFLEKYIENSKLRHEMAVYATKDLCEAVLYCHKRKVCHNDIKPENILIFSTEKNTPIFKLGDFGITSPLKLAVLKKGTPGYYAPEVFSKKEGMCDKSDMWSVGVVAYSMYVGSNFVSMDELSDGVITPEFVRKKIKQNVKNKVVADFISKLLKIIPGDRMTAKEALKHPYLNFSE